MANYSIDQLAANIAKDILVAKASASNAPVDAENGKKFSEFYNELFNGISETLHNSAINTKNRS